MKRQIIKTRPARPYVVARIILGVVLIAAAVLVAYEIAVRAGLHFH
jgi:hypothetical protein